MAKRRDIPVKDAEAFTLRLAPQTAKAFRQARGPRSAQDAGEDAIVEWIRRTADPGLVGDPSAWESLREIVVSAVTEELSSRTGWAEAALQRTSLIDPAVSIYLQRVNHFHFEKIELSGRFVQWLVGRVLHHAKSYKEICIVIESGTTLKSVFDSLGPELLRRPEVQDLPPGSIQIITNNFPGAESYEALAQQKLGSGASLSQSVPCHLVPGKALREYSAVVGDRAESYLTDFCSRGDGNSHDKLRIGLAVGNWIMLDGSPARPIPLARGDGHKTFKEAVLSSCDETFLISPLCKVVVVPPGMSLRARLADFNRDFQGAEPDGKGDYFPVEVEPPTQIRLVTTARLQPNSIVHSHSLLVSDRLGVSRRDKEQDPATPFEELRHIAYDYDAESKKPRDKQIKVELPHPRTRDESFAREYFNI